MMIYICIALHDEIELAGKVEEEWEEFMKCILLTMEGNGRNKLKIKILAKKGIK